jgi:hypothetical protein
MLSSNAKKKKVSHRVFNLEIDDAKQLLQTLQRYWIQIDHRIQCSIPLASQQMQPSVMSVTCLNT